MPPVLTHLPDECDILLPLGSSQGVQRVAWDLGCLIQESLNGVLLVASEFSHVYLSLDHLLSLRVRKKGGSPKRPPKKRLAALSGGAIWWCGLQRVVSEAAPSLDLLHDDEQWWVVWALAHVVDE